MTEKQLLIADLKPEDLKIRLLGESRFESPLSPLSADFPHEAYQGRFIRPGGGIFFEPSNIHVDEKDHTYATNLIAELAGARQKIFFDPRNVKAAIVTCGGLCPGINDVIRGLVMTLHYRYGVKEILGIPYGYQGLDEKYGHPIRKLTPESVSSIHYFGGSILYSSRGSQDPEVMVETLQKNNINMLFTIGGDGTQRGALALASIAERKNYPISIVGIPKTIDNDILFIDQSFGFETAFSEAVKAISCAHTEAHSYRNGVGIVKLMGRDSGFIACHAALAMNEANFVLIPEVPFSLNGKNGFLKALFERLAARKHAVIVVAEGAGQDLMKSTGEFDPSGNKKLSDIGHYLSEAIKDHARRQDIETSVKYIDPSYMIRGIPATPSDSLFCLILAENAVHAAMSGRTSMVIAKRHGYYVHLPMELITRERRKVNPRGYLWSSVLAATGQPPNLSED
ncbi:MAG: ATP-dependent 6-phosphofructokinase [Candidatus Omnitrophica bacterium]|nr:ATP-dependent 6-phosphofructokinase [Candidatus Omnitrophota bacterium]